MCRAKRTPLAKDDSSGARRQSVWIESGVSKYLVCHDARAEDAAAATESVNMLALLSQSISGLILKSK